MATQDESGKKLNLFQLVNKVHKHEIDPDTFIQGVYGFYKDLEVTFANLRQSLEQLKEDEVTSALMDIFLRQVEDSYYIFRLALIQFEGFVGREEPTGLRIGMELVEIAQNVIQDVTNRANAVSYGDSALLNRKDVICAAATEVLSGKLPVEKWNLALDQLTRVFEPFEKNAYARQEDLINKAKELIDIEDEDELRERIKGICQELPMLADAYGRMILLSYSPQQIKRSYANLKIDQSLQ